VSDRYCQQCGAELDDAAYCSECGAAVGDDYETTDNTTSTENGPFQSPRRAVGSLNLLGFVSFLLAIGLNAVGLPITALPHPIPIALFAFWFGVIVVGLPLWGLLHVTDNVLGFLKSD